MIQSATAIRSPSSPAGDVISRRTDGADGFRQSLAAFLDGGADDAALPAIAAAPGNDDAAADGKALPDDTAAAAPTLAWLAQLAPSPVAAPVVAAPTPVSIAAAPLLTGAPRAAVVVAPLILAASPAADAAPAIDPPAEEIPRAGLPNLEPVALRPAPVADLALRTAPAAEMFGAAIQAAVGRDDTTQRPDTIDGTPAPLAVAGHAPHTHAVLAAGEVQQAPLDTRQGDFAHQMIDRIVQLRDDANANDTRIRLVPDALGRIDVTMRRDGEAVHVHFAAEQAATRALLTDAQPQLAQIAATRGLTLGQTSVGSDGGHAQRQPQHPTPPWQPPRAAVPDAAPTVIDDIRIA
jgi:flagellar hook-length control protein FliK